MKRIILTKHAKRRIKQRMGKKFNVSMIRQAKISSVDYDSVTYRYGPYRFVLAEYYNYAVLITVYAD